MEFAAPIRLDMEYAATFKRELSRLIRTRDEGMVLDMSAVTYMGARPLTILLLAAREARAAGRELVVKGLHGQPYELAVRWGAGEEFEWARQDSNLRPTDYESAALTT